MSTDLEESRSLELDFDKLAKIGRDGHQVVPVVLQDVDSRDVLFVGYANEEAFLATLERRSAVLYSTSRNELWHKGATSGDVLDLVDVAVNCEQNSLLYLVRKAGSGVCHTKNEAGVARQTCYYRMVKDPVTLSFVLADSDGVQ
jgi:phosphoribosyl-AMP cyclohydrolase